MLSHKKLISIAMEYMQDEPQVGLNMEDVSRGIRLFRKLMKENVNKRKSNAEQERLFTYILPGLKEETDNEIFIPRSDNKHLYFFENFGYEGLVDDILKALHENKLTAEILKGITKGNKKNKVQQKDEDGVHIIIEWGEDENGYPQIENIEITEDDDNGKEVKVFEYDRHKKIKNKDDGWVQVDKEDIGINQTFKFREVVTPNFSYTESAFINKFGEEKTRRKYAKGTIINGIKVGGRFF